MPTPTRRPRRFMRIELLPAHHGDCLWIEYGDATRTSRVLVDCGTRHSVGQLEARVGAVPSSERAVELFVLSHIDDDHIGGAIPFLDRGAGGLRMGDVWFNGRKHLTRTRNAAQGDAFSKLIVQRGLPWNVFRDGGAIAVADTGELPVHQLPGGLKLTVLSPTVSGLSTLAEAWDRELARRDGPPTATDDGTAGVVRGGDALGSLEALADTPFDSDTAAPNGSSIALLAEFAGKSILLAADAHAPVLEASIRRLLATRKKSRLKVSAFKVSHHASRSNVSRELVELLDCRHYLVSTNGSRFHHPHREAIARLITRGGPDPVLHFNYETDENRPWANPALQEQYGFRTRYPTSPEGGIVLDLP